MLAAILVGAIAVVAAANRTPAAAPADEIPVGKVTHGDLDLKVHADGELRANHAMTLGAPAVGGDALQITRLLHTGALVKKGDIVIEFDPSEENYKLEQNRSELLQAEQEITKANADAAVLAAQDKVALLKAGYDVRKAELDVQKNELVGTIDASKNNLALNQAKRVLAELEQDVHSHTAAGQASVYLAEEKRNKARLAMDEAQQNIQKMRVQAPMDGIVSIARNMGGVEFFFSGMSVPYYHAGDQAQAGSTIAQVIDPMGMELTCKIGEQDHDNIRTGQAAEVEFNALPGVIFHATVKNVGAMTTRQFFEGAGGGGTFDVSLDLSHADARLRPGLTAQIVFEGGQKRNVLYVPRQALFLKDGRRSVYIKNKSGYEQREVTVRGENESRAAIDGLNAGDEVALIDPTAPRKPGTGAPSPGLGMGSP
jgi:HlyD family secretion protein